MEVRKNKYEEYVKQVTPVHSTLKNVILAFLSGGTICLLGQILQNLLLEYGLEKDTASAWTLLALVFTSVLLTGLNLFQKIARWAGAGVLVPITGFANAMVSPAMEFKNEGLVTGTAVKLFTVAGPVLVFGISASVIYGLILWLIQ